MTWPFGDRYKHREAARKGWETRRKRAAEERAAAVARSHQFARRAPRRPARMGKRPLPTARGRDERQLRSLLRDMPNDPYVQETIRNTPSTGHMDGNTKKMVKEVNNWPESWMPEHSPARSYLKQEIARDSDETYVYYPIGAHKPVIWHRNKRWTLEEFEQRYGQ